MGWDDEVVFFIAQLAVMIMRMISHSWANPKTSPRTQKGMRDSCMNFRITNCHINGTNIENPDPTAFFIYATSTVVLPWSQVGLPIK